MVMAVLSLQLYLQCELQICSSCDFSSTMNQHLVPMFLTCFFVNTTGSADTDEHCSYLSPFEPAASVNFVCLVPFV